MSAAKWIDWLVWFDPDWNKVKIFHNKACNSENMPHIEVKLRDEPKAEKPKRDQ